MKKQIIALVLGAVLCTVAAKADVDNPVNNPPEKFFYTCSDESGMAFKIEKKIVVSNSLSENNVQFVNYTTSIDSFYHTLVVLESVKVSQFLTQAVYKISEMIPTRVGTDYKAYKLIVSESVSLSDDNGVACGRRYCPPAKTINNINAKINPENQLENEKLFSCHI